MQLTAPFRCLDQQFTEHVNVVHLLLQNCPHLAYEMAQRSEGRVIVSNAICGWHLS